MHQISGSKPALVWTVNITVAALALLWLFPTAGLFVSSFRTVDQISASGWWSAMFSIERNLTLRTAAPNTQILKDGTYIIEGQLFDEKLKNSTVQAWGTSSKAIAVHAPDDTTPLKKGGTLWVDASGNYRLQHSEPFSGKRGKRVFITARVEPQFTFDNYDKILFDASNNDGIARAFFNTLTVTIPATVIPILIAAFAAYALAWMEFPGRALLITLIVGLLVVPIQLALIPLLELHLKIGIGKGYLGTWLAHTGFGLPLAIYLLRNYMIGLPKDIIENARIDGASEFRIFTQLILPLSFPALASFAIFQFLWTWNDLLVSKVFLIDSSGETTVMTAHLVELLGSRGGNWEILATAAFVSIAVPLTVFFALQKYLVRGLLAGSVK